MCSWTSGGMPLPLSAISTTTLIVIQKRGDANLAGALHGVDGVINQVRPDLVEFAAVGHDAWNSAVEFARDGDVFEFVAEHGQRIFDALVNVHFLHRGFVHV